MACSVVKIVPQRNLGESSERILIVVRVTWGAGWAGQGKEVNRSTLKVTETFCEIRLGKFWEEIWSCFN